MPFFTPITTPEQLPRVGDAIEHALMDWKAPGAVGATAFHKAKDVAAFANHLGGVILVGACEGGGQLAKFEGMTADEAGAMQKAFSQAVEQRCQPAPTIDFERFEAPGSLTRYVLSVNVSPSLLLVGVKLEAHKPTEGYGGVSFVYPVRVGIDAKYLEPSEIAMHMTPQVRRVAVLLSRVPIGALMRLRHSTDYHPEQMLRYIGYDEDQNLVSFESLEPTRTSFFRLPLDCVTTVFSGWDTTQAHQEWRLYYQYNR